MLRALERAGPCGLAELQAATGLPRATAHRLASGARAARPGAARRATAGSASGSALVALGQAAADGFPLAELARPALAALRDATGESVQLFVREGDGRRCVVSLQSPHGLRWIVAEGALLPLHVGSAGRVLSGAARRRRLGRERRGARGRRGIGQRAGRRIRTARSLAAVSVSGPVERLTRQPGERFGAAVVATASGSPRWPPAILVTEPSHPSVRCRRSACCGPPRSKHSDRPAATVNGTRSHTGRRAHWTRHARSIVDHPAACRRHGDAARPVGGADRRRAADLPGHAADHRAARRAAGGDPRPPGRHRRRRDRVGQEHAAAEAVPRARARRRRADRPHPAAAGRGPHDRRARRRGARLDASATTSATRCASTTGSATGRWCG